MTPQGPSEEEVLKRRRMRSIVMAVALGAFAILMFAITIAKMSINQ
jgi:hypothetical protein